MDHWIVILIKLVYENQTSLTNSLFINGIQGGSKIGKKLQVAAAGHKIEEPKVWPAVAAWIYRPCQNSLQTDELLMIKSFRFANCQTWK